MKFVYSLVAVVAVSIVPGLVDGAVRGFHEPKEEVPEEVNRQLMMGGGSMSAPEECPNLAKGRPVS